MAPPVAYLVLSHTDPPLVARLVDRLLRGDPECEVVVDHDAAGPPLDLPADSRLHRRASDRPGGWGGFGLVAAVLDALRWIRAELDPGWVVLLSGQDYPARPPAETRERLHGMDADACLDVWDTVPAHPGTVGERWWHARYFMRWYAPPGVPSGGRVRQGLERRLSLAQPLVFVWSLPRGAGTRIGLRRRRTPFGPAFPCRTGSQWFALARPAIASVLDQAERRPELVEHYKRTVIPDESFFVTLVANDPALRVAEGLTYVRFEGPGGAHAATLGLDDLPAIAASGRAFARKIVTTEVQDALDRRLEP